MGFSSLFSFFPPLLVFYVRYETSSVCSSSFGIALSVVYRILQGFLGHFVVVLM